MRHAKAESFGPSDHARELARSGMRDAAVAGRWLHEQAIAPDAALVSDATRTRATWLEAAAAGGFDCPVDFSAALYAAGPESALDLIRTTEPSASTLVVVGHNPTMAYVAQLLDDGDGDPEASAGMVMGYPTAAMSVFTVDVPWSALELGSARLRTFHVARAGD